MKTTDVWGYLGRPPADLSFQQRIGETPTPCGWIHWLQPQGRSYTSFPGRLLNILMGIRKGKGVPAESPGFLLLLSLLNADFLSIRSCAAVCCMISSYVRLWIAVLSSRSWPVERTAPVVVTEETMVLLLFVFRIRYDGTRRTCKSILPTSAAGRSRSKGRTSEGATIHNALARHCCSAAVFVLGRFSPSRGVHA